MSNIVDNQSLTTSQQANTSVGAANLINRNAVVTNNENSPPKIVDYYIKRPKTCNLLDVSSIKHLKCSSCALACVDEIIIISNFKILFQYAEL